MADKWIPAFARGDRQISNAYLRSMAWVGLSARGAGLRARLDGTTMADVVGCHGCRPDGRRRSFALPRKAGTEARPTRSCPTRFRGDDDYCLHVSQPKRAFAEATFIDKLRVV